MIKPLERLGITMLINESVEIQVGTDSMWILGLDDPHYYECDDYPKANRDVPAEAFRIVLVHTTGSLPKLVAQPVNLYFCGHTHAGQIRLPIIGAPITHSRLKGQYVYGPWQYQHIQGYTTSGAGTSGIPVRYNTRSEIVVITLQTK
jgi:predicted MPP superfamily phosphohydrolase